MINDLFCFILFLCVLLKNKVRKRILYGCVSVLFGVSINRNLVMALLAYWLIGPSADYLSTANIPYTTQFNTPFFKYWRDLPAKEGSLVSLTGSSDSRVLSSFIFIIYYIYCS